MSDEILHREFDVMVREGGDGRTLIGRAIPFGEVATVADPPDFVPYRETVDPKAFDRQLNAANRVPVWLNFQHEQGLRGIIGNGISLDAKKDGLHAAFRVLPGADGDKALQLFHDGVATKLSAEYVARKTVIREGVRHRMDARLLAVALVPEGAYQGAEVLAVREASEEALVVQPVLKPFDPALAKQLERFVSVPAELIDSLAGGDVDENGDLVEPA